MCWDRVNGGVCERQKGRPRDNLKVENCICYWKYIVSNEKELEKESRWNTCAHCAHTCTLFQSL